MSRVVVVSGTEWSLCHAALRPIERPEKGVLLEEIGGFTKVLVMASLWLSCLPVLDHMIIMIEARLR